MTDLRVATVVCTYTQARWDDLLKSVDSLARQSIEDSRVIVVVDHDDALLERARRALPSATVVPNSGDKGLSGARNSGVLAAADADVVAFLDDDAFASDTWLERLLAAYADPGVIAAGGKVEPAWDTARPPWFPEEFDWVVGCSYRGLPEAAGPVRNMIGANMSFRRSVLAGIDGFVTGIGRIGTVPLGCEETELCIRATGAHPGARIVYEPAAVVAHRVPAERARVRYFFSRCMAEGRSKAAVARLVGAGDALRSERRHVTVALPLGVLRGVGDLVRGKPAGLARAAMILAGTAVTAVGYVRGKLVGGPRS